MGKHIKKRKRSKRKSRLIIRRVLISVLAAVLSLLYYATILEPRNVELVVQDMAVPGLPQSVDGMKVVQLSDLHRSRLTPNFAIEQAVRMANDAKPDLVVLTGDYVSNNALNAEPCAKMLSRLKSRLGTYAILGNHDYMVGADAVTSALEQHGIHVLVNANVRLPGGVYLIGLDDIDRGKRDVPAALRGVPADACRIFLVHNPMSTQLLTDQYSVLLSGHTHGGQIRNPFLPGSRHPQSLHGRYIDGWYLDNGMLVYVNRGIGVTNVPFRVCCRPEVTLFILHPEASSKIAR